MFYINYILKNINILNAIIETTKDLILLGYIVIKLNLIILYS